MGRVLLRPAFTSDRRLTWIFRPLDAEGRYILESAAPPEVHKWEPDGSVRAEGRLAVHIGNFLRDRGVGITDEEHTWPPNFTNGFRK